MARYSSASAQPAKVGAGMRLLAALGLIIIVCLVFRIVFLQMDRLADIGHGPTGSGFMIDAPTPQQNAIYRSYQSLAYNTTLSPGEISDRLARELNITPQDVLLIYEKVRLFRATPNWTNPVRSDVSSIMARFNVRMTSEPVLSQGYLRVTFETRYGTVIENLAPTVAQALFEALPDIYRIRVVARDAANETGGQIFDYTRQYFR